MSNTFCQIMDNSSKVLDELDKNIYLGLRAIGVKAEGYAKNDCPVGTPESTGIPDYIGGTLRGSITYATAKDHDRGESPASSEDYAVKSTPDDLSVYIGTNVKYAPYVEYIDRYRHQTGKAHFLRDAVSTHNDEYKATMEAALKSGGDSGSLPSVSVTGSMVE